MNVSPRTPPTPTPGASGRDGTSAVDPSSTHRLLVGVGEAPWWVHLAVGLALSFTVMAAAAAGILLGVTAAWTILLAILGLTLSATGAQRKTLPSTAQVVVGYLGVLIAGASPYFWWAWSDPQSSNRVALLLALTSAIGLVLATRSGLLVAIGGCFALVALASGATSQRAWLVVALIVTLCALSVFGYLSNERPHSSRTAGYEALRRSFHPTVVIAAVLCVIVGLLLEGPVASLASRLGSSDLGSSPAFPNGGGGPGSGGFRTAADPVFRPGELSGGQGTLQYSDSFSIDSFGGAGTMPVLQMRYFQRRIGYGVLGPSLIRGQAFDSWDGNSWSANRQARVQSSGVMIFDRNEGYPTEPLITQAQVELLGGSTDLVFGEGRIATIDVGIDLITVNADETIRTATAMGKGSRYLVFSTRHPWRDGGPATPRSTLSNGISDFADYGVRAEHLDTSAVSDRTRQLALTIGNESTTIEGVEREIEKWLAANTGYDFTARQKQSPNDIVDDFLFESQRGWCEQVATATVMMLRVNGIPARLATGYLPSSRDKSGTVTALSRDAHAWVEMYLPGRGWAPRDPTAAVPLIKGPPDLDDSAGQLNWTLILVIVGAFALVVGVVALARPRLRRRHRVAIPWSIQRIHEFESFAAQRGTIRTRSQTLSEFACHVQQTAVPDARVGRVGQLLERERFAGPNQRCSDVEREWVEAALADLERQFPQQQQPRSLKRGRRRAKQRAQSTQSETLPDKS